MRARLALAQALLPQPELLILDEPGNGLDPEGIAEMRQTIARLHRELGLTILLSSHLLERSGTTLHRIAVLNQGRKVFEGKIADVKSARGRVLLRTPDFAAATGAAARTRNHHGIDRRQIHRVKRRPDDGGSRARAGDGGHCRRRHLAAGTDAGGLLFEPDESRAAQKQLNMFFAQLNNELWKLFGKKRTYIGFGAFVLVQIGHVLMFHYTRWQSQLEQLLSGNGYLASEYMSALTVAVVMLSRKSCCSCRCMSRWSAATSSRRRPRTALCA